jgi:uncharacterized membrane protein
LNSIYLLSVWLHIVAAVVWIGGMLFMTFVMMPVVRDPHYAATAVALVGPIGRRFRVITWALLFGLVATGLINASFRGVTWSSCLDLAFWSGRFGMILAVKLAVFTAMVVLSLVHDFVIGPRAGIATGTDADSGRARLHRRRATVLGRINIVLGLVVIALAAMLVRF